VERLLITSRPDAFDTLVRAAHCHGCPFLMVASSQEGMTITRVKPRLTVLVDVGNSESSEYECALTMRHEIPGIRLVCLTAKLTLGVRLHGHGILSLSTPLDDTMILDALGCIEAEVTLPTLEWTKRDLVERAILALGVRGAARALGVDRVTLQRMRKKHWPAAYVSVRSPGRGTTSIVAIKHPDDDG
jgi:ActR/RegA family two-component response regulator